MKIMVVLFNDFLEKLGGAERGFADMANFYVSHGQQVSGVCCRPCLKPFLYHLDPRVTIYNANDTGKELTGKLPAKLWRELTKPLINRGQCCDYYELEIAKKAAAVLQKAIDQEKPDFIIFYNETAFSTLKYLHIGQAGTALKLNTGELSIANLTAPRHRWIFSGLKMLDFIHVYLPYQKKLLQAKLPSIRIEVIPNEVSLPEHSPRSRQKRVVMVSRMVRVKRPDLLIRAFSLIASQVPDWTLHLYGKAEERLYLSELKQLIAEQHLQKQIFLEGPTTHVEQVLAEASIFVFPSRTEGFGKVLAEAMQEGLPCIGAQDCPASNNILGNGRYGLLCQPTPAALSQALLNLIKHKTERKRYGAAGKAASACYTPQKVFTSWLTLINKFNKASPTGLN